MATICCVYDNIFVVRGDGGEGGPRRMISPRRMSSPHTIKLSMLIQLNNSILLSTKNSSSLHKSIPQSLDPYLKYQASSSFFSTLVPTLKPSVSAQCPLQSVNQTPHPATILRRPQPPPQQHKPSPRHLFSACALRHPHHRTGGGYSGQKMWSTMRV